MVPVCMHTPTIRIIIYYKHMQKVFNSTVLDVLRKHYNNLWRNFPTDHMITLSTMCEAFEVEAEFIGKIISCSSSEEANKTILDYVISITKEHQVMTFCNLMERMINDPQLSEITNVFRTGLL